MVFLKAYKYRIYPSKVQRVYLNQNFGCVRFVWNQLVENFNNYDKDNPSPKVTEKTLKDTEEFAFLKEAISYALQQKRIDFDETKKQFFNKKRKVRLGKMQFKKKGVSRDSFRIPFASLSKANFNLCESKQLILPKMKPIKVSIDRKFTGKPKNITVSKNASGQYFVSVLVEEEVEPKQNTGRCVGIDLGLIDIVTLSTGDKVKSPKIFRKNQAKLATQQRHLSRKIRKMESKNSEESKPSNRYIKQRIKVARIHNKIANQRNWFNHNLSSRLVSSFDIIIMENLNLEGMKKIFGKSVSDCALGDLTRQIEYKCKWYGKLFHKIDRFQPTSKICSACGHQLQKGVLKLSDRKWVCPECGTIHDRDFNASVNILNQGLKDIFGLDSEELPEYRHREVHQTNSLMDLASKNLFLNKKEVSSDFIEFYKNA